MDKIQYTISEAVEQLKVEAHVLRYWEEKLELVIPRNESGHRYYTNKELQVFEEIKVLKNKGLQLRAIKAELEDPTLSSTFPLTEYQMDEGIAEINIEDPNSEKAKQFLGVLQQTFQYVLEEYQVDWEKSLKEEMTFELREEISEKLDKILQKQENLEKERFQKVDQTLREVQKMRQELAVSEQKNKKEKVKGRKWYERFMLHSS